MKTIKGVSELTGLSIRTLRYYDEIGLLKPSQVTQAGYRLYDNKTLEQIQQIMFFRELEIPLAAIQEIMQKPDFNKEQALLDQKYLLEQKRNHLNGIIELITDVMKGVNTMSFEAFNEEDIKKIVDHTMKSMSKENLEEQVRKYGGEDKYGEYLAAGFKNEQSAADLIKWYGSKEKAMEAVLQPSAEKNEIEAQRNDITKLYAQFRQAKETENSVLERESVQQLAENYKAMFQLDNARAILLDLGKEYLQGEKLAEVTDTQFGEGISEYIALAIRRYYGE